MSYPTRDSTTGELVQHKPQLKEMDIFDTVCHIVNTYGNSEAKNKLKEKGE